MSVVAKRLNGSRWHWHGSGPWSRPYCARWGPSSPPQKGDRAPQFFGPFLLWPNGLMPLGMEVGLSPGDFVLDVNQLPPKRAQSPIFGPCLLLPNGCMYQDTTWYGGRPQPRLHCVRWGPSSPSPKGAQPPIFGECPLWPNGWMD